MKHTKDRELGGHALVADSALDLITYTARENEAVGRSLLASTGHGYAGGAGVTAQTWAELLEFYRKPWAAGLAMIRQLAADLRDDEIPGPQSRRRRQRWSEDGEVDADRALAGEYLHSREAVRSHQHGPQDVVLLIPTGGASRLTPEQMSWRGAAAAVLADLLEEAGYGCEIWCFYHGVNAMTEPGFRDVFVCWPVKQAGEQLDADALAKSASGWFFRTAVLETYPTVGPVNPTYGRCQPDPGRWADRYTDSTAGVKELRLPASCLSHETAALAVRKVLAEVARQRVTAN